MSFLRHTETHQKLSIVRGRDRVGHALAHRADESPVGYSWRVALQQSPLPLHQPAATLQQWRGELQESIRWNIDPNLTCGLTSGAHPTAYAKGTEPGSGIPPTQLVVRS